MLPEVFNDVHDQRRFLNVLTGKSVYGSLPVPDTLRSYVLGTTPEGLVLLLGTSVGLLLNPLTGQVAEFPSAASLLVSTQRLNSLELRGAGLAADNTVVLHFRSFFLAVAKAEDKLWTHIHSHDKISSILPFAGHVYCATLKNISLVETQTIVEN